jgi:hypothetical protein
MLRVDAASVKLADVTKAICRSTTTHLASRQERFTASLSSECGS